MPTKTLAQLLGSFIAYIQLSRDIKGTLTVDYKVDSVFYSERIIRGL